MNTLKKQFSDALKREGKTITTYYKNETVKCLFRMINDNNNKTNHITIFYDVSAPIEQGQLLSYGAKQFVTMNKESVENDTYYKSTLLECNLILPVVANQVKNYIPCYMYDLTSPTVIKGNVITTVDGNGKIITESTNMINNITYDTGYWMIGGYFKVTNKYNINGISHVFVERGQEPQRTYTFDLTSSTTEYDVDTTTQLVPVPTIDSVIDDTATITYSSSDELIATVDSNGLVTFLVEGSVTITATWTEQNLSDTITVTVVADAPPVSSYTMEIVCSNPKNELTIGGSVRIFTPILKDGNNTEVSFTPTWTFELGIVRLSDLTITYDGNSCKIKVKDNYDIIGETIRVICTDQATNTTGFLDALIMI